MKFISTDGEENASWYTSNGDIHTHMDTLAGSVVVRVVRVERRY